MAADPLSFQSNVDARLRRVRRAVLIVDLVESVRLMEADEDGTIARWRHLLDRLEARVADCPGAQLVKSLGDGVLADFDQAQQALELAAWLHGLCEELSAGLLAQSRMRLRIGLHVCAVVRDHRDIFGGGVNLAARLAALAHAGGTVLSEQAMHEIRRPAGVRFEDLGACHLKHLDRPVRAYRVVADPPSQCRREAGGGTTALDRPSLAVVAVPTAHGAADAPGWDVASALERSLRASRAIDVVRLESDGRAASIAGQIDAALERGIGYLLSATIAGRGERVELSARLFDTRSARQRWAGSVLAGAGPAVDPLTPRWEAMSAAVCRAILDHERSAAGLLPPSGLSSLSLQGAAVAMMHSGLACDFENAHGLLECLVERHPRHAAAHAWLAQWHVVKVMRGLLRREAASALAAWHARRAVELDPGCSTALAVLGYVQSHILHDLPTAARTLREATSRFPDDPLGWSYRAVVSGLSEDRDDSLEATRMALRLPAPTPVRHYCDSLACTTGLRDDRLAWTVRVAKRSLAVNPAHSPTLRALAIAQVRIGRLDDAKRTVLVLRALQPELCVESYLALWPGAVQSRQARAADDLRRAGMPECSRA